MGLQEALPCPKDRSLPEPGAGSEELMENQGFPWMLSCHNSPAACPGSTRLLSTGRCRGDVWEHIHTLLHPMLLTEPRNEGKHCQIQPWR